MTTSITATTATTSAACIVLAREVIKKHTASEQVTTRITVEMWPARQEIVTVTRAMGRRNDGDGLKLVHVATDDRRTYGAIREDWNGYWWLLNKAGEGWNSSGYTYPSLDALLGDPRWAGALHIYPEQSDEAGAFLPYTLA